MLGSFETEFDYGAFIKKLKRYFADTAPIYAQVKIGLGKVAVSNGDLALTFLMNRDSSVRDFISVIIADCEKSLYPRMASVTEVKEVFSQRRVMELLMRGHSLERAREKEFKKRRRQFVITRFNAAKNTIDYRCEFTGGVFRARLNRPLIPLRGAILTLSKRGLGGRRELYKLVTENSKIEELDGPEIPANFD